nr:hypothetical protein [uncultured Moellerella sp.]
MLKHIALATPIKRKGYKKMYQEISQPKLLLLTPQEVNEYYKQWDL